MSFKILKHFSCGKVSFFLLASLCKRDLKLEKFELFLSEILNHLAVGLIEKALLFPYLEVKGVY